MYPQFDTSAAAPTVRRPIQCGGLTRGPERIADVAVTGAMKAQVFSKVDLFTTLRPHPGGIVTWL